MKIRGVFRIAGVVQVFVLHTTLLRLHRPCILRYKRVRNQPQFLPCPHNILPSYSSMCHLSNHNADLPSSSQSPSTSTPHPPTPPHPHPLPHPPLTPQPTHPASNSTSSCRRPGSAVSTPLNTNATPRVLDHHHRHRRRGKWERGRGKEGGRGR